MKNLYLAIIAALISFQINPLLGQTILQEDFETLNLPNGWTLSQSSPSVGFEFGTANSLTSQYWVIPPRTNIAATNDDRYDDNSASLNIADQDLSLIHI